jgi:trigger factor
MQVAINNLPKSKIEIFCELSWEEFSPYLDKTASELSKELEFKGFRPGRVPREILEKEIGQGKILAQGAEMAVKEEYPKIVIEKKLEVIGAPQVEILKLAPKNPFSFKIRVDVLPEIRLPDYKKIARETPKKGIVVEEKEVQETLKWLRNSRAKFKDLEREAEIGDLLEIEYRSSQIENGKVYQDRFLLGKGQFVPGFEENLKGMKKGEEKEFTVRFPKDYYQQELAEKPVKFKVKVKKIQEVKFPEINDEFAKSLGRFENIEDLKKSIKEGIAQEKEIAERERRRNEILERISKDTEFEIPEVLVSLEKERMFQDLKQKVKETLKIPFDEYLQKAKKREQDLKDSFSETAKKRVKNFLILREIGKKENIKVGEEEVTQAVNNFLKNYPSVEKAQKEIDLDRLKEYYKGVIYNEKVFQLLENL